MKKILLVNSVIIFLIFSALEFISYLYIKNDSASYVEPYNKYAKENGLSPLILRYAPVKVFNQEEYNDYRPIKVGTSDKKSLLFFGCSYIAGSMLENEMTLPYIISERTGRTAINRGIGGGGIFNMLYDLNSEKFFKEISSYEKPEYIIYLWIYDQFNRIYNPYISPITTKEDSKYMVRLLYKEKDGQLIADKPNWLKMFLYHLFTTKAYYYLYSQKTASDMPEERNLKYFTEAKKITDKKFPGSKFVIIQYKDGGHCLMSDSFVEKLKENGFIVLDSEELAGHELESEKWRAEDKEHPNYEAFKDVATGLIKELNL